MDTSGSDDDLIAEGMHLQARTKTFLARLKLRLRKRKPEEPSAEDTQQKKPRESQEEIKLALTAAGFGEDVKTVIRCLKERNVNRVALITKLWEVDKNEEDISVLPSLPDFSHYERARVSSLLLGRLERETEGTEIAAALAVCNLVTSYDHGPATTSLIDGGLIALLVKIVSSHRDQADVVERGLFVVADMADCSSNVYHKVAFVVAFAHPRSSFSCFSSDGKEQLIELGIVLVLEKILESYTNNHDVTWAACTACYCLALMGKTKAE